MIALPLYGEKCSWYLNGTMTPKAIEILSEVFGFWVRHLSGFPKFPSLLVQALSKMKGRERVHEKSVIKSRARATE